MPAVRVTLVLGLLAILGCSSVVRPGPLSAGSFELEAGPGGGAGEREFLLHIPAQYDRHEPLPLVLAFHGSFSSAEEMEEESGLSRLSEQKGFAVAYPFGHGFLGLLQHWNSGHCCGPAYERNIDDVEFARQVISSTEARITVDRTRIYVVGMSNGAMLAHRVAAELSDRVAAAAAVSGTIGGRPADDEDVWRVPVPSRPVPMLIMHGDADEVVPYEGGHDPYSLSGRTWLSVDETVAFWRRANHASRELPLASLQGGRVVRREWRGTGPSSGVVLYEIAGWEHAWPGGPYTRDLPSADPLSGFEAADPIWEFLARYRREPEPVEPTRDH